MANEAAWQAGWDMGAGRKKKTDPGTGDKGAGKKSAGGGGSGKLPWYTLGGLIQRSGILGSKKKGGPIRKTGLYLVHKGEYVIPAKQRARRKTASRKRTQIKA